MEHLAPSAQRNTDGPRESATSSLADILFAGNRCTVQHKLRGSAIPIYICWGKGGTIARIRRWEHHLGEVAGSSALISRCAPYAKEVRVTGDSEGS